MRKKGFTLIELLAVIVILSVIALIAVPLILKLVEQSRKGAFLNSAYGIKEAAEEYYISSILIDNKQNRTFTFPGDTNLSFKGERPKSGYVQMNQEGKIELQLYNGKWCAYKNYYVEEIYLEEGTCTNFKGSLVVSEVETTRFKGEIIDILEGVTAYDVDNNKVEDNIGYSGTVDRKKPGDYHITYYLKSDENVRAEKTFHILDERYHADFDYTGNVQKFEAPYDGIYQIELWGASGGSPNDISYGQGSYTKGSIHLKKGDTFYVYVGEKGKNNRKASFNGGGYGGYGKEIGWSGGGATDIRLTNGDWNNVEGLKSRIMVAGGGGGATHAQYNTAGGGSYAGGLTGYSGGYYSGHTYSNQEGKGGSQEAGGAKGNNIYGGTGTAYAGSFGIGGNNDTTSDGLGAGGGGGGYYGGGAGGSTQSGGTGQGGGGGSSFISGYAGCNAINKEGKPTGQANHISNIIFRDSLMLSGKEEMPNPRGAENIIGNTENGYARITLLHDIEDHAILYVFGEEQTIQTGDTFEEPGYDLVLGTTLSEAKYHVVVNDDVPSSLWKLRTITYLLYDDKNQVVDTKTRKVLSVKDIVYDYTGDYETFTVPYDGVYQIELWGASGGIYDPKTTHLGRGGYTRGTISLKKGNILYVYVGEKGKDRREISFNGGGYGGYGGNEQMAGTSGGGATDIRLISGNWNNIEGLKSRIMVAGGGGGVTCIEYNTAGGGSYAGGLIGDNGGYYSGHSYSNQEGKGGSQILGGAKGNNIYGGTGTAYTGGFGIGGNNDTTSHGYGAGGGGGGYYGGGAGGSTQSGGTGQGGGGGSSFISGHAGCNAVSKEGIPTGQANHYSGYIFKNTSLLSGRDKMPNPREQGDMIGNNHNGYVRIKYISF